MIRSGELLPEEEDTPSHSEQEESNIERKERFAQEIHQAMTQNMSHLTRQEERGISGVNRWNEILKILVVLLLLGVLIWFLFYRK